MKNYKEVSEQLRNQNRREAESETTRKSLDAFFQAHRGVRECEANREIIRWYFDGDVRLSQLEDAYANHLDFRAQLATETETDERERLQNRLIQLRNEKNPLEIAAIKASYKPTSELRSAVANAERRVELQAKTAAEVWKMALEEAGCTITNLPSGWREMSPAQLRQVARVIKPSPLSPIPPLFRTRTAMRAASPAELRRMLRDCGQAAVDAVLSQTDAEEDLAAAGE